MTKTVNFTPEEAERIMRLPSRKATVGGEIIKGYYDASTGEFFQANENGQLTGKVSTGSDRNRTSLGGKAAETTSQSKDNKKGSKDSKKTKSGKEDDSATKKKKMMFFIVVAIVFVFIFLFIAKSFSSSASTPATEEAVSTPTSQSDLVPGSTVTTEGGTEIAVDDESVASISVIQAVQDILKGEVITEDMIQVATLSIADYNQLIASGVNPCKYEDVDSVLGMYAACSIQASQYVFDTDLSVTSPVATNPWNSIPDGYTILTIPVDSVVTNSTTLCPGDIANLEITRSIVNYDEETGEEIIEEEYAEEEYEEESEESEGEGESEEGDSEFTEDNGMTIEESVSQHYTIYSINDVIVCDVLNAEGNSTYPYLVQYFDLSEVKRLTTINALRSDEEFVAAVTPAYVVVRITNEQAETLGDTSEDSVVLTLTGENAASTSDELSIYDGYSSIDSILNSDLPAETETDGTEETTESEEVTEDVVEESSETDSYTDELETLGENAEG